MTSSLNESQTGMGSCCRLPHRYVLAGLLLLHLCLLAYASIIHGPGFDEGGHLPAGISHWQLGNTDLYRVNPPLARMVATLPLAAFDFDMQWRWDSDNTVRRPEWILGAQFWELHGRDAYWYLTVARWASLPWSLLAAYMIFVWSRDLFGSGAGLFAAALWCFSPLVLTNAQMMTPDTAATAMGGVAAYSFQKWLRSGLMHHAYEAGLMLGLAELTKFTWVILFGLWPAIWLGHRLVLAGRRRVGEDADGQSLEEHSKPRAIHLLCLLLLALLVINAGYGFAGSFQRLGDYTFVSRALQGEAAPPDAMEPQKSRRGVDSDNAASR